jgi:hypothetical protein
VCGTVYVQWGGGWGRGGVMGREREKINRKTSNSCTMYVLSAVALLAPAFRSFMQLTKDAHNLKLQHRDAVLVKHLVHKGHGL